VAAQSSQKSWLAIAALAAACVGACNPGNAELPTTGGTEPLECSAAESHRAPARLLTRSEYDNAVRDLLGDDTAPATHSFPPEPEVNGFNNDAASLLANPLLVEKLSEAAREVAQRAMERGLGELAPCATDDDVNACARSFLEGFGKRAFRRPLVEAEVSSFLRLFRKAEPGLGYNQAIALLLDAMLQSPQFLYRVEAPLIDAESPTVALGPYEMASRLSFFLWGSVPDEELLHAADEDELSTAEQVAEQARRLLADERARGRVREFHAQWLGLGRFETVARSGVDDTTRDSWKNSILAFTDDAFWGEGGTVHDLYTSKKVFVDETLASLYDVDADVSGSELVPVKLDEQRSGLLTQPGLMAMLAHPAQSSPIQRGVFVREKILCAPVPAPPPSVNNNPPDPDPSLTTRERFAVHTEDAECATCHRMIDPLGFGFEEFDQLGRYRATENGEPVDASGEIVHAPDESLDGPFDGARELSARLASSELVLECLTRHWYRFALGRGEDEQDECHIQSAAQQSEARGGSLEELLVAMTQSQAFRYRAAWPEENP
jgi:hypothetical protein